MQITQIIVIYSLMWYRRWDAVRNRLFLFFFSFCPPFSLSLYLSFILCFPFGHEHGTISRFVSVLVRPFICWSIADCLACDWKRLALFFLTVFLLFISVFLSFQNDTNSIFRPTPGTSVDVPDVLSNAPMSNKGGNSVTKLSEHFAGLGYIRKCIKMIIFWSREL